MARRVEADMSPAEKLLAKWAAEKDGGQSLVPDWDADFSASFPNLWVLLTWDQVGKLKKQPGRLTLSVDGTGWRLTYMDPTAKRSTAVVQPTLMEALKKLDAQVVAPDTVWTSFGSRNRGWREEKRSV